MRKTSLRFFFFLLGFIFNPFLFGDAGGISKDIVLDFTGDIMSHTENLIAPDYKTAYRDIANLLQKDDLSFANLEFVIDETTPILGYPRFNVHREYVEAAIDSGLDVFSLANNHIYDLGISGVFQTIRAVAKIRDKYERKVFFSGIRGNPLENFKPVLIRVKGIRLGFVAVTQFLNRLEESPYVFVADYRRKKDRERLLEYVRKWSGRFDIFILSYHGGVEYSVKPDKRKVSFFHRLIKEGVDIVYSHHPHVIQRFELVPRDGATKLILYSTGNLISGMVGKSAEAHTSDSAIFRVYCRVKGSGNCCVIRVRPILITNFRDSNGIIVIKRYGEVLSDKSLDSEYYHKRYLVLKRVLTGKGE